MRNNSERLRDILEAIDLRNITVHEYFRINLDIIWDIVNYDIPPLKRQIEAILSSLSRFLIVPRVSLGTSFGRVSLPVN